MLRKTPVAAHTTPGVATAIPDTALGKAAARAYTPQRPASGLPLTPSVQLSIPNFHLDSDLLSSDA
jgi:hypothetical protein